MPSRWRRSSSSRAEAGSRRITLGADKACATASFVLECREENVTPHVTPRITATRGARIDARTTRHPGYAVALRIRKRIEGASAGRRRSQGSPRVKLRGLARADFAFVFGLTACNLVRLPKLLAQSP